METPEDYNNPEETHTKELHMSEKVQTSILASIQDWSSYNLACVLYYMYENDIVLLSKKHDIWLHKINTTDQNWEITDSSFINNIFCNNLYNEFKILGEYYSSISTSDYCPYIQTANNILNSLENISYCADDSIEHAKDFFELNDPENFFNSYVSYENLITIITNIIHIFK